MVIGLVGSTLHPTMYDELIIAEEKWQVRSYALPGYAGHHCRKYSPLPYTPSSRDESYYAQRKLKRTCSAVSARCLRSLVASNHHATLRRPAGSCRTCPLPDERELAGLDAPPLQLRVTSLGSFQRVGVLFAEIEPTPGLLRLQAQAEERMARCGFVQETRTYRPHITLARLAPTQRFNRNKLALLMSQVQASFRAESINLYRSHLNSAGSSYEILAQKRLGLPPP